MILSLSPNFSCNCFTLGIAARQGPHQEAQKSMKLYLPGTMISFKLIDFLSLPEVSLETALGGYYDDTIGRIPQYHQPPREVHGYLSMYLYHEYVSLAQHPTTYISPHTFPIPYKG